MQTVGELDQDHAQVARHREQHLAETFRGRFLQAAEHDLVELGHAIDERSDGRSEFAFEFVAVERRVFERVVQDRGDDRFRIHAQIGKDRGDRDRMRDVRFAAFARLSCVRLRADQIRLVIRAICSRGK